MMEKAAIKIDSKAWDRFMEKVQKRLVDPRPMLRTAFSTAGFKDVIEHFEQQKGPDGAWKPRTAETQLRYAMIGSGQWSPPAGLPAAAFNPTNKLLQQTGDMRQGFLPGNLRDKGRSAVEFFNNDQKSAAHDEGTDTLPARPFMWLSDRAQETMGKIILEFLADEKEP